MIVIGFDGPLAWAPSSVEPGRRLLKQIGATAVSPSNKCKNNVNG